MKAPGTEVEHLSHSLISEKRVGEWTGGFYEYVHPETHLRSRVWAIDTFISPLFNLACAI